MTRIEKRPTEFYGRLVTPESKNRFSALFASEHCPFLERRCVKQRKSNSKQTIGSCSVGYRVGDQAKPLVICPHRFLQDQRIFLDCAQLLEPNHRYLVVPEVTMPGGNIDYFIVAADADGEIIDYAGIEIQALDTTGSGGIWNAREDLAQGRLADSYSYGINWKMSAKTILVQMHHKAAAFEALNKKLVLVIQSEFYNYMVRNFRTTRLEDAKRTNPIHFHCYDVVVLGNGLKLSLKTRKSTDIAGVELMLGSGQEPEILASEVEDRIRAKLPKAFELGT